MRGRRRVGAIQGGAGGSCAPPSFGAQLGGEGARVSGGPCRTAPASPPVLQFLAPSSVEEPAVRSSDGQPPSDASREQVEVYPESSSWDVVLGVLGSALLGGGILLLLLTVRGLLTPAPACLLRGWKLLVPEQCRCPGLRGAASG